MALKVLTEYYGSAGEGASQGAASGIMGLLETVESQMSKDIAELKTDEEMAAGEYEKLTKENEIGRVTKEKDVSYKTKEAKQLDKDSGELTADKAGVKDELDA